MRDGGELVFALRLASHLRRPLSELVATMPAFEYALWLEYYSRFGFDVDRLEWATANAGAAPARAFGSEVTPADLIPRFSEPDPAEKRKRLTAWLESLTEGSASGKQQRDRNGLTHPDRERGQDARGHGQGR